MTPEKDKYGIQQAHGRMRYALCARFRETGIAVTLKGEPHSVPAEHCIEKETWINNRGKKWQYSGSETGCTAPLKENVFSGAER